MTVDECMLLQGNTNGKREYSSTIIQEVRSRSGAHAGIF